MFYNLIMRRTRAGSTPRQYAYATKRLSGAGGSKKDIALSVGYPPSMAKNAKNKIENTEGYQNAVIKLAHESNNLVLAAMAEYKARGLKNFSNKDLNGALNAIGAAWEKFNRVRSPNGAGQPENPIKAAIMIKNQTINMAPPEATAPASNPIHEEAKEVPPDLDF